MNMNILEWLAGHATWADVAAAHSQEVEALAWAGVVAFAWAMIVVGLDRWGGR